MKKSIFSSFFTLLVIYVAQACGSIPTLESIYATTVTPTNAATSRSIYDYLYDLDHGRKPQEQDLVINKGNKQIVHIEPGVHCQSGAHTEVPIIFSTSFLPEPVKTPGKLHFYWPGAPARALYSAGYYLENKTISSTCITFEYPDTRATLNIAQALDQQCLNLVVDEVIEQGLPFVLFGKCRGATNILTFLTNKPQEYLEQHVRAVVIESAPLSLKHICEQTMRALPGLNLFYWLSNKKSTAALYALFRLALPNHRYQESEILNNLRNIPKDLPILVAHVLKDTVVFDQDIKTLLQKLLETGHTNVHLLLFDDAQLDHYTISDAPAFPLAVNAFFRKYNLHHTESLACEGERLMPGVITPLTCPAGMSKKAYVDELWATCALNPDGSPAPRKIS